MKTSPSALEELLGKSSTSEIVHLLSELEQSGISWVLHVASYFCALLFVYC
jgi:hypothetical protein